MPPAPLVIRVLWSWCLVSEEGALDDGIFTLVYSCICRILDMFILGTLVTHAHRWHFLMEGVYTVQFECIRLPPLIVWVIPGGDTLCVCMLHTIVGACVLACLCLLHTSVCLRMLHISVCVCVCVLQRKPLIQQTKCPQCHGDVHGPWQKGEMRRWGDKEIMW